MYKKSKSFLKILLGLLLSTELVCWILSLRTVFDHQVFQYSLACRVLLRMHSALFKIHSGRERRTLKMVSVPFSVGLQAVPRCLG